MALPLSDLKVLSEVMLQIEAEESLLMVQKFAVGSGSMTPNAQRNVLDSWQGILRGEAQKPKRSNPQEMLAFARISGARVNGK